VCILLVEDEAKVARFVARRLQAEGHTVETVGHVEEARTALASLAFDLIILDLMLPGTDGIPFCRELRVRGNTTPILMLTAHNDVKNRVQALDSGADDCLPKPFALVELLARVRALLRRPRRVQPMQLCVADLTVDLGSRRAWRGDREIALSPREYALLTYLMANPDRMVGRRIIEGTVWCFACESNVVDVCVGRLRRKLEAGGEPRLIHAVRSGGYILRSSAAALPED
jgi:DNA-binding response OmpR family regulator